MGLTACTEPQCLYKGALYLSFTFYILDYVFCPNGDIKSRNMPHYYALKTWLCRISVIQQLVYRHNEDVEI